MTKGILFFLTGILVVIQLSRLPSPLLSYLVIPCLLLTCAHFRLWLLVFFLSGCLWAIFRADILLSEVLPDEVDGQAIQITGQIKGLTLYKERSIRFDFEIAEITGNGIALIPRLKKVRLSWYGKYPEIRPDETWHLTVKMKQPHGFRNPGGFDYEAYLFQNNIRATGYVLTKGGENYRIAKADYFTIDGLRNRIRENISHRFVDHPHFALILAVIIGDRSAMTDAQWRVLTETGTSHLLAISGLHIGMIAGFMFLIMRWLMSLTVIHFCSIPAQKIAAVCSIIAAILYAGLAGFSIPTQRALIMVVVTLVSLYFRRPMSPVQILSVALFLILVHDPFSVLSAGFWLSFSAISILMYGMLFRVANISRLMSWGYGQLLLVIGMAPVMFFWFQQAPMLGGLANIISVPWVSFITLPLLFIGTVFLGISESISFFIMTMALISLDYLWSVLLLLEGLKNNLVYIPRPSIISLFLAIMGSLLLLMPLGIPGRWLGACLLLPMIFPLSNRPAYGTYRTTTLEVGQGLAVVIETENHTIVYDTGPRFSQSFDAGEDILLPYIHFRGIREIDLLVQSHGDLDHIGGLQSLLDHIPVIKIISSVPDKIKHPNITLCRKGQFWIVDGVTLEVLHPIDSTSFTGNNASCVLKLDNGRYSVLLTGDIEKPAEQSMLEDEPASLAADFLIAPHHGSMTSSTEGFIHAVQPDYVIFPVGHGNRFGFPKSDIIARYQRREIKTLDTAISGAIELTLGKKDYKIIQYGQQNRRFWYSGDESL
jgi:competence protein ComEC